MKTLIASLLLLGSAGILCAEQKLTLEFPPPMLTGTPVPVKLPHLEKPNTPPPTIMVPDGVTNLAAGKEVLSSDDFPIIGELELITDGDKESDEGYYVELAEEKQWVQIDLGAPSEIYGVAIWHFHSQKRAYHDVVVQISDDPEFGSDVKTIFNNDHDNSSGFGKGADQAYIETNKGKLIDAKKTVGRYVRLYSNGNTANSMNHYVEVEIFGKAQ